MRLALSLAVMALPLLSACATLSEDECRAGDWTAIGYEDGTRGKTPDYVEKHRKACEPFGIVPDVKAWLSGREKGLPLYCTPRNVWEEGADGHKLSPVCPAEDLEVLERQNWRGLTYYRIGQDIAEAEREISRINSELASLPPGAPGRSALISEISLLRLEILSLRAERLHYRY